jgi:hypothetical protein
MASVLNEDRFQNEEAAFAYVKHTFGRTVGFARIAGLSIRAAP